MLPAGEFMMGSPDSEAGRKEDDEILRYRPLRPFAFGEGDEGPRHRVTIPRSFAVGKYEVTMEEYRLFQVLAQGRSVDTLYDIRGFSRYPETGVSWHDAKAYAAWLSQETGHTYRLLSESEWEYAARAGRQTTYHWGESWRDYYAHCIICGPQEWRTEPVSVGRFPANDFGLHDMHGNVWEWVEDCWNDSYDGAPSDGQAWLSGDCDKRVLRGGSWYAPPELLRADVRDRDAVENRYADVGFRVARTN